MSEPSSSGQVEPKRKKSEKAKSLDPNKLGPCRVCGARATGFHYGVNTCEPCKGFYRRTIVRKEPYVCVKNAKCNIEGGIKNPCPLCRYKKCMAVGMSVDAIKIGRYTNEKRTRDLQELLGYDSGKKAKSSETSEPTTNHSNSSATVTLATAGANADQDIPIIPDFVGLEAIELPDNLPEIYLDRSFFTKQTVSNGDKKQFTGQASSSSPSQMFYFETGTAQAASAPIIDDSGKNTGFWKESQTWPPGHILHDIFGNGTYATPNAISYTQQKIHEIETITAEINQSVYKVIQDLFRDIYGEASEERMRYAPEQAVQMQSQLQATEEKDVVDMVEFIQVYTTYGVQIDDRYQLLNKYLEFIDMGMRTYIKMAKKFRQFKALDMDDQVYLIKSHSFEMWLVLLPECINTKTNTMFGSDKTGTYTFDMRKYLQKESCEAMMTAVDAYSALNLQGSSRNLLAFIILFTLFDKDSVKNPEVIRRVQGLLAEAFMYSVRGQHGDDAQFFSKLLSVLDKLSIAGMKVWSDEERRLVVFKNEEPIKNDIPPLINEVFQLRV